MVLRRNPIPMLYQCRWLVRLVFTQGNIDAFEGLQYHGGKGAKGNQKLMMGAFGHVALKGDLKYPADAGNLNGGDPIRWFDYWMKGIDNGIMKEPAVRYFMMGAAMNLDADKGAPGNEWRTSAKWPPDSTATSYYLTASHTLATAEASSTKRRFRRIADPEESTSPTSGSSSLMMPHRGPMDQRAVSGRDDVLKFETEPLKQAVEVAGKLSAELTVSTDAADTDFIVKLVDVYPNGYEALVVDQPYRLRYWKSLLKAEHVEKNKAYTIHIDLWSTALVFNAGRKIPVLGSKFQVSALRSGFRC